MYLFILKLHTLNKNFKISVLGLEKIDNIATAIQEPSRDKNPSWTLRRPVASPAFDVLFSLMIPEPEKYRVIHYKLLNYENPLHQ